MILEVENKGLECPKCGCSDINYLDVSERWGQRQFRLRCNNDLCGHFWVYAPTDNQTQDTQAPASSDAPSWLRGKSLTHKIPLVRYMTTCCPHCKSERTLIQKTDLPYRYHRCCECKRTFKSIQEG